MIWVVFLLFFSLTNCNEIDSSEDKLIHTQIIFRHSDRNTLFKYALDPYKDEMKYWPEGFGELTINGMKHAYNLGLFLRRRYDHFIGSYSANKVSVWSSDFDRTINSANLVLAGFFPPKGTKGSQVWNEDLLWNPIAVHTIPLDRDVYLDNESACPRYLKAREEYDQSPEMLALVQSNQELFNYVETHTGETIRTIYELMMIREILVVEIAFNRTLPEWTKKLFASGGMEFMDTHWMNHYAGTREIQRLKSGFLLKRILDRFQNKTLSLLPNELMQIYSAHDHTIGSLFKTLGIFEPPVPPFSSSLMFELYESKDGHYIQLFYRNTTAEYLTPIYIPHCGTKCSLHRYYELYGELLASNPEIECALDMEDAENGGNVISSSSILGYYILVLLIFGLRLSF